MRRFWFVTNGRSGSTADTVAAQITDTLSATGHEMAGQTGFPDEALPSTDMLASVGEDGVVLLQMSNDRIQIFAQDVVAH